MNYNTCSILWNNFLLHNTEAHVFIHKSGTCYHHLDPSDPSAQFTDQEHAIATFREAGFTIVPPPNDDMTGCFLAIS